MNLRSLKITAQMNSILPIGQLLRTVGNVEGRKKLQKLVHLLQHFGAPFGFRYGYLNFGPYSSDLQSQLQVFEEEGLIKETPVQGFYRTSRFEAEPELNDLVSRVAGDAEPEWSPLAARLSEKSGSELEALSTIIFLREGGKSGEALKRSFCDLKPKLAPDFDTKLQEVEALEAEFSGLRPTAA